MVIVRRQFLCVVGAGVALPAIACNVWAQNYPARPVRVIVPYAPGGPTDLFARPLAQKLSEYSGKQFYVENMGGAGGNIGMGHAARAAPDGYTILVISPNYAVNPTLYDKVAYDPDKDFAPITLAVINSSVLTVHPAVPAHSVKDLVDLIKANPGKYSYASPGAGTPPHLLGELFRLSLGLDLVHVPFNGGGLALASAVAGHTPISFGSLAPALPQIKEGNVRALAVASKLRAPLLPEVPTMAEAGYQGIESDTWWAVLVPAGTPGEIVTQLHRGIAKVMALPEMRAPLEALGYRFIVSTPEECAAHITSETARWAKVIREAGIRTQ